MVRRVAVLLAMATLSMAVFVPPAAACSCAPRFLEESLADADTAVAVVIRTDDDHPTADLDVLQEIGSNDLPPTLTSPLDNGGSCELSLAPGGIAAIVVDRRNLTVPACPSLGFDEVLPELPDLETTAPVAGVFHTWSWQGDGPDLGLVHADGVVSGLTSVVGSIERVARCPDDTVATVRRTGAGAMVLELRAPDDLSSVRHDAAADDPGAEGWPVALHCDDAGAVAVVARDDGTGNTSAVVTRLSPAGDSRRTQLAGATTVGHHGQETFVAGGSWEDARTTIQVLDPDAEVVDTLTIDGFVPEHLVVLDRDTLVLSGYDPAGQSGSQLRMLDRATGEVVATRQSTGWEFPVGVDADGRVLVQAEGDDHLGSPTLVTLDRDLEPVDRRDLPGGGQLLVTADGVVLFGGRQLTVVGEDFRSRSSPDLRTVAIAGLDVGEVAWDLGPAKDDGPAEPSGSDPVATVDDGRPPTTPRWLLPAGAVGLLGLLVSLAFRHRRRRSPRPSPASGPTAS